jgi:hypothetical protein
MKGVSDPIFLHQLSDVDSETGRAPVAVLDAAHEERGHEHNLFDVYAVPGWGGEPARDEGLPSVAARIAARRPSLGAVPRVRAGRRALAVAAFAAVLAAIAWIVLAPGEERRPAATGGPGSNDAATKRPATTQGPGSNDVPRRRPESASVAERSPRAAAMRKRSAERRKARARKARARKAAARRRATMARRRQAERRRRAAARRRSAAPAPVPVPPPAPAEAAPAPVPETPAPAPPAPAAAPPPSSGDGGDEFGFEQ